MGSRADDDDRVRAGDADRDRVAEVVREAFAHGRLGADEVDDRLCRVLAARTRGELSRIVVDLPHPASGVPAGPITALLSTVHRQGPWTLPDRLTITAVLGSVRLDLSEAVVQSTRTTIVANAVMGSVILRVPDGVAVEMAGTSVAGSRKVARRPAAAPDAPVLRIEGTLVLGSVLVHRSRPPARGRRLR